MSGNFTCKYDPSIGINNFFWEDLDSFRCGLATMTLILYNINFGYICLFLLLLLAIISIFGGIKADYRWFILNQVIWDALMSSRFVCHNYIGRWFYHRDTCFSSDIIDGLYEGVPHASYSALLLLSFSRFLSLYFKTFYDKLTQNRRIFVTILIYNFIIIITSLYTVFGTLASKRVTDVLCTQPNETERDECYSNPPHDLTLVALKVITKIQIITSVIKPPICLLLSIFSTIMIIIKISKQFKSLSRNNKNDFYISLRITAVIAFQTLLYSCIFVLEVPDIWVVLKELGLITSYPDLPKWYQGAFSLTYTSVVYSFIQVRIFLESLIVLLVMGGYREAVIRFFKNIFAYFGFKFIGKSKTEVTATTHTNFH